MQLHRPVRPSGQQQQGKAHSGSSRAPAGARRTGVVLRASDKYDAIIVGGGAAGCVLANRLTATEGKKVLLLEAGQSGDALEVAVPAGLPRLFRHPTLDWGLTTPSQPQLGNREVYLARGKALGGSSCTNATLYHRGSAEDYDSWGLEGWKSKDVLNWFVQAEDFPEGSKPYHGVGGTMKVGRPRFETPLHDDFFHAAAAAGIPENPDFNDWSRPQVGYGEFQVTQKEGTRADMYRTYLKPAMSRGNLQVKTGARTTRIAFEKGSSGTRAVGVEYATGGASGARETAELAPGGEVLLCSGAIHSPYLLQLSGIGAARHLADMGVPLVADLPGVGQNLQDHPAAVWAAKMKPEYDELTVTRQMLDDGNNIKISAIIKYLLTKRGPLATTGCDHGAFIDTTGKGGNKPDLQIRFVPTFALDPDGVQAYIKFAELKKLGVKWPGGVAMQLLAIRAKSKGSVGLNSSNPFQQPKININYLSDPEGADMATLKNGIQIARQIASQSPLARLLEGSGEDYPGKGVQSDADLEAYIRRTLHSGNALVGTCRMGASAADGSVVSSADLRVHGIENLRVVDSSVIPTIPGGQTGAPTVMIAERAAAMLLAKAPRVPALATA